MHVNGLSRLWSPLLGLGIAAIAAALILPIPSARAQQTAAPASFPMTVTENRVPGAAGQVTITPQGNNQLLVAINITGLPPSPSSRAAHIHTAPGAVCDNNAPVTYPLDDVMVDSSGHGTSTTTITVTPDKPIMANNAYVNVHEQSNPAGPGVICANITESYNASGASAGPATPATTGVTTAGATAVGAGECVPYDSWCAFCTSMPNVAACKAFVPAHAVGTTASGAMGNSGNQLIPGVTTGGLAPLSNLPAAVTGPLP